MKRIAPTLFVLLTAPLCAQDAAASKNTDAPSAAKSAAPPESTPAPSAEKKAVDAVDRAYEGAFEKGDAKAIADLFTEDAEFTSDDGRIVSGRAAIEAMSRAAFQSNKGATLVIASGTARLLAPGVIVQKGSTSVTSKNGEMSGALFTAVLVDKDGKWKYSQVIETPRRTSLLRSGCRNSHGWLATGRRWTSPPD